ncbi:MAG: DNA polymerase I [Acidimicrobiia bacterium]|nr:DNA polymerase I [Acidimicrobiia bacterium]
MPTLALLDGHSLAYRAFYALPEELATTSGQVTNAAYGFMRMLVKLLGDHHPDRLAVTWDVGRSTFRTEEFAEYKAQRESAPDHFKSQLPLIDELLEALGIKQFRAPGFEADDVIATLVRKGVEEGFDVLVVTGDRDSFQLVNDHVRVVYTRRGISDVVMATSEWIEGKYGVRPDQYVEYAALRGDNSDNLPGVRGVGEKTAARLIADYGGLEGIFEHLDEMTPKLRQNLEEAREQAFLNRRLMKLVDTVPLKDVQSDHLVWSDWDEGATKRLFESLEFHTLWNDLLAVHPGGLAPAGAVLTPDVDVITSMDPVLNLAQPVGIAPVWDGGRLDGLAFADGDQHAYVLRDVAVAEAWLRDDRITKTVHDSKGLMAALGSLELRGVAFDPSIAAYVINPTGRAFGLDELADRYLNLEIDSVDVVDDPAQGAFDFDDTAGVNLDAAGRRAIATRLLFEPLSRALSEQASLELFNEIEMPLVPVLHAMEERGIGVDRQYLVDLGKTLRADLLVLEAAIHELAGETFNVNSTAQLRTVLYDKLELPVLKKTSKGVPSTDASVLAKLEHPIVEQLLRYRELEKLRSTYVDGFLPLITSDGRIHTTFNQLAAATGRLSSDHPNLQNIPVRSETGRTIRRAFVAGPGNVFVVADYSQIELRILAHMCRDEGLLSAFGSAAADVHTATAASVFGVPLNEVTVEQRRRAKAINFGLLYGMEAYGLSERLEISRDEAKDHIETYFAKFPDVQAFMQSIIDGAKTLGYTETVFGRRRYLPELRSDNWRIRQMGERMALNAPVQGTAADIIKLAMLAVEDRLDGTSGQQLLQIHDELVVEVAESDVANVTSLLVEAMEGVADLAVPLKVDVGVGRTLADVKA